MEIQNEAFWDALDRLVADSEIIIDRPKGSTHPRYPAFVYPADYGYLKNTASMDGGGIDVWFGTDSAQMLDAIICTVDLIKRDSEIKLLIGCTSEEKSLIYQTCNETSLMKGIMMQRNPIVKENTSFAFSDAFDTIQGPNGLHLEIIEKNPGDAVILPFYWYDIYAGGKPVGKISIRIGDNYHSYYNGHVGYEVDPEYRGHRYSLEALKLVLPIAKHHGMERIYLTCDQSNEASRRIIELSGARLLEIAKIPRDYFAWREGIEDHCIYQLDIR